MLYQIKLQFSLSLTSDFLIFNCYRKKDESQEKDFKDAVTVCLPLINAAIRDIEKGTFPKSCSLNVEIPTAPLTNKVCKPKVIYENYWLYNLIFL